MPFPQTPLAVRVDLNLAGAWTNITSDVLVSKGITISRGRADEASRPDPQTATLELLNRTGKYSPRNPRSPYYGLLGRNTPLRIGVGTPPIGAAQVSLASSTSLVAPSVTAEAAGRLVCVWGALPAGNITVPGGFTAGTERDGVLSTWQQGTKTVTAGATGPATATHSTTATAQCAASVWVPGAATTLTAYSAIATAATVSLSPVVATGDMLVVFHGWSSDPDDEMVRAPLIETKRPPGWMLLADSGPSAGPRVQAWGLLIDAALAGTLSVQLDAISTADNVGRIQVITGVDPYYARFCGEASTWPVTWDLSQSDISTPIVASGVRRRLGSGASPLRSAMYRRVRAARGLVGYWPMEDTDGATAFSSALGGTPMTFIGTPALAADEGFPGSESLPTFSGAGAKGKVPDHTVTNDFTVGVLVSLPVGLTDEATLLTIQGTGTVKSWTVKYDAGLPGFRVEAFDADGASLENEVAGVFPGDVTGAHGLIVLDVFRSGGSDLTWSLTWAALDNNGDLVSSTYPAASLLAGQTAGRVTSVKLGSGSIALNQAVAFGHLFVLNSGGFSGQAINAVNGYAGFSAAVRLRDLCRESDILLAQRGLAASDISTELMGVQRPRTLLELFDEAADADGGVLFEPKGFLGFQYRDRTSMLSQASVLTLDYLTSGHVGYPFEPVDDDQRTVNDVTVTRIGGASARQELTAGALSTAAPPAGVGRYDTSVELSLYRDAQAADRAGWILHLGTVDEARWPTILTRLEAVPSLIPTVAALEIGEQVTLTNLPTWVPPGPTDLILEGYTEFIDLFEWTFEGHYSPGSAWRGFILDSTAYGRLDSENTTLDEDLDTTETAVDVLAGDGAPWITTATHPAEFPFDVVVGGEQMTVTACVALFFLFYRFTVVRSVNGVVKTHATGARVRLAKPMYVV